jgi:RNA polymerase sigma-70 factor (ECF subfamily)
VKPQTVKTAETGGGKAAATGLAQMSERPGGGAPQPSFDFEGAVDRFQGPLTRYVTRLLGAETDEAEDVVQEVFLRLHQQVLKNNAAAIENLRFWLTRVAHNLAMDTGRKRSRRKTAKQNMTTQALANPHIPAAFEGDAAGDMAQRELCEKAMAEVFNLPQVQREAILLRLVEGLTMKQIAEIDNTTASNIFYRFNQGMAALTRTLKRQGLI